MEFLRLIRVQLACGALLGVIGFVRVVPVEDFLQDIRQQYDKRKKDRMPAPLWSYFFLAAFTGLVLWIGWKTMYAE